MFLFASAQKREEEAFNRLCLPMKDALFRQALAILRHEDDARDAVQELWLRLWTLRTELREKDCPQAFAATVMHNICHGMLRARHTEDDVESLTAPPASGGDDDESRRMDRRSLARQVSGFIFSLPEPKRSGMTQRVFAERPFRDIARDLNLSEPAVRQIYSRLSREIQQRFAIYRN